MGIRKIISVLILMLLLSCGVIPKNNLNKTTERSFFTINTKENWEDTHLCGSSLGLVRIKGRREEKVTGLYFSVSVRKSDLSLIEFSRIKRAWCKNNHSFSKVIMKENQLPNSDLYIEEKEDFISKNEKEGKRLTYYYHESGYVYTLTYSANRADFEEYLPEVKEMMSSFVIVQKDANVSFVNKVNQKISLDKNPGWKEIFYCGDDGFSYSRKGMKTTGSIDDLVLNVRVLNKKISLYDYVKSKNEGLMKMFRDLKIDVSVKPTKYGACYVENKQSEIIPDLKVKSLTHYYKVNSLIYEVSYSVNSKVYDKFLGEARGMMNSVKILESN